MEAFFADTPMGETRRARAAEVIETQRTEFQAHDLEIGFRYDTGALVPDGSAPPPSDPMGRVYHPTTRPGHRLPHAWLDRGGDRVSTHDLVPRDGFVLLTDPSGSGWSEAARSAAEKFGVAVQTVAVGPGGDVADADGGWAQVREIQDGGAVLVRPDNHVAYRAAAPVSDPVDALAAALGAVLAR
jgi:2,4-dichlorophenol 6-monooxygenase